MLLRFLTYFFADDMLIFSKVNLQQTRMIKTILDDFSKSLGLQVNLLKTKILFSTNVISSLVDSIAETFGF